MTGPEKIISEIKPDRVERLWWFLHIMSKSGGETDASDTTWNWINAFCQDFEDDTFNLASDLNLIKVSHDSTFDTSSARLTEAGKSLVAYFEKPPSASLMEERDRLRAALVELDRYADEETARAFTKMHQLKNAYDNDGALLFEKTRDAYSDMTMKLRAALQGDGL